MNTNVVTLLGGALLSTTILSAGVLHLEHGWDLVSFGEVEVVDINKTLGFLENGSFAWIYDNVNKNWLAKSNTIEFDAKITDNNISFAHYVNEYQGLWIYNAGSTKDIDMCQIMPKEIFFEPIADAGVYAYSYRNWNNANLGAYGSLNAGYSSVGGESRVYIQFDVSNIDFKDGDKAYLRLENGAQYAGTDNIDLAIYAVTSSWNEGNGTYHSGYTEATAPSDQITWNNQPSIDSTLIAVFNPSDYDTGKIMKIEITPLIRLWKNGLANNGLVIKPLVASGNSQWIFPSREYSDINARPGLIISKECNVSNE